VIMVDETAIPERGLVIRGTTYVPLRALSEALGATVQAEPDMDAVFVTSKAAPAKPLLRTYEGAWTVDRVKSWCNRVKEWNRRTSFLLNGVNESRLTGFSAIGESLADSYREEIRAIKRKHSSGSAFAGDLEESPYDLPNFLVVLDNTESVARELSSISDLNLRTSITGAPDVEQSVELSRQASSGYALATEAMKHRAAMLLWHRAATDVPIW
ncbi:MAG: hypothetical protein EOP83_07180, partial [Verrucomicrobiaceae bacterium]